MLIFPTIEKAEIQIINSKRDKITTSKSVNTSTKISQAGTSKNYSKISNFKIVDNDKLRKMV